MLGRVKERETERRSGMVTTDLGENNLRVTYLLCGGVKKGMIKAQCEVIETTL